MCTREVVRELVHEVDANGKPTKVKLPMDVWQQAAFTWEYYDEFGKRWQEERGVSNIAWGKNPTSLLTERAKLWWAEKSHTIHMAEDKHFTMKAMDEVAESRPPPPIQQGISQEDFDRALITFGEEAKKRVEALTKTSCSSAIFLANFSLSSE